MIKLYTAEVIGVDADDEDRTIFKLHTFDECSALLSVDTLVMPSTIAVLCLAIQQALERMELANDAHD